MAQVLNACLASTKLSSKPSTPSPHKGFISLTYNKKGKSTFIINFVFLDCMMFLYIERISDVSICYTESIIRFKCNGFYRKNNIIRVCQCIQIY
jgi:hypothetical protein